MHEKDNDQRHQREVMKLEMTAQLGFAKLALEKGMKMAEMEQALGIETRKDKTKRQEVALTNVVKMGEHQLKRDTGSGI